MMCRETSTGFTVICSADFVPIHAAGIPRNLSDIKNGLHLWLTK